MSEQRKPAPRKPAQGSPAQGKPAQGKPARQEPAQPQELRPPVPVQLAFWIWIASAVLSLVSAVLIPREKASLLDALRSAKPQGLAPNQYETYVSTLITINVIEVVLFGALYVFFAYKIRAGRSWARMTLTVLVVVGVAYNAYSGTLLSYGIGLLIGAAAVVLVYFPSASAYFAARKRLG